MASRRPSPAFAAALYGDRVLTLFTLGDAPHAVVELTVAAGFESPLGVAAIDYRFAPVGLAGRPAFALDGVPTGHRLTPSERLTVVVAMADLDRLLRREAAPRVWRVIADGHPWPTAESLTRGEAEELQRRLVGEGVGSRLEASDGSPSTPH